MFNKLKYRILIICMMTVIASCASKKDEIQIAVGSDAISFDYIGNGVEWDPYDEAISWGAAISDSDWQKLFARLDYMRPAYVRCMINSPFRYYDAATGKYDKTRNIASIARLLQYCTDHHITVIYGEFNPPTPAMKNSSEWVDMSVDYLNYLVNDLNFSCIKYFVIFNEPDGAWAKTNGDYDLWKAMLLRFSAKMKTYPGLWEKVKFAAPDVVVEYANPASKYSSVEWVKHAAAEVDSLIGVYDVHAYPGQHEVRAENYAALLAEYQAQIPADKKIVLGEAGYKYWRPADSLLMKEYNRRLINHPFTKGSDCNMLVYDAFYGLDMPLLCMTAMNAGYSGIAAWMLDDAMHSSGDSGKPQDIKLWGMWNILGAEVFHDVSQEDVRPWYYTWSLMCRYFPAGCNILKTNFDGKNKIYATAAELNGKYSIAVVNTGDADERICATFPFSIQNADVYLYENGKIKQNVAGFPVPVQSGLNLAKSYKTVMKAQSLILITNIQ